MENENQFLSFEKLAVWEKSVAFSVDILDVIDTIDTSRKHFRLIDQIEASSTSIAMNIAEGKGRWSQKEFKQFLYYSRGSLYETITLLLILKNKGWIEGSHYHKLREKAMEINKMLNSLIFTIKQSLEGQ